MPRREKYAPKHRTASAEPAPRKGARRSLVYAGVAAAATAIAVSSGIVTQGSTAVDAAAASLNSAGSHHPGRAVAAELSSRTSGTSRSDRRAPLDDAKKEALDQASGGQVTRTEDLSKQDPRTIARTLLPHYGFSTAQFGCLDSLYNSESGWNPHADNPTSSAYGIPQALTAGTHADLPSDYRSNPASQIRWGLDYIRSSYGTPCSAWDFKQSHDWY